MAEHEQRVLLLASGDRESGEGGSTAARFADDALKGVVGGITIGAVICNNPPGTVGVYDKIEAINKKHGLTGDDKIDVINIGPQTHPGGRQERGQTLEESSAICRVLEEREIDFVSMQGYLRILTGELLATWAWQPEHATDPNINFSYRNGLYHPDARIMNNHPGILPLTADTWGHHTHERAMELYEQGMIQATAMTWHLAAKKVDDGPTVDEEPVFIDPTDNPDTLGDKVQDVEKERTIFVLRKHLDVRLQHVPLAA